MTDARLTAKGLNRFDEQPGMYRVLTDLPSFPSPEGFEMKQVRIFDIECLFT